MNMRPDRLFLLLLLIAPLAGAQDPAGLPQRLTEPVDAWMNGDLESARLLEQINELDRFLLQEAESWETLYWRSRVAYVRGKIAHENGDQESSIRELERSAELARNSNDIRENSDSWRIMAECTSLIMLQRGFAYIILNFSKGQAQARRALELDPRNARASHIVAQFLCSAPRIAGGNLEEGLELLRTLAERDDLVDEDRFIVHITLSEVLQRENRLDEAELASREALDVYPGNQRARDLLRSIERGER